jgi:hypothetical protein
MSSRIEIKTGMREAWMNLKFAILAEQVQLPVTYASLIHASRHLPNCHAHGVDHKHADEKTNRSPRPAYYGPGLRSSVRSRVCRGELSSALLGFGPSLHLGICMCEAVGGYVECIR